MTDKEQNKSEVEQSPTPKDGSTGMNLRGKDRRRFIKTAIVTAPVILTVAARPVWAWNDCTLSGMLSGNMSGEENTDCGEGCTPGYWHHPDRDWGPTGYYRTNLYDSVFGVYPGPDLRNSDGSSFTLGQVIDKDEPVDTEEMLAFHAVAALLNAGHPGVDFIYTKIQVISYVQDAYSNRISMELVKDNFADLNELGSFLCD